MEANIHDKTRFMLQTVRVVSSKIDPLYKLIDKLRSDANELEQVIDKTFAGLDEDFRNDVFEINNVPALPEFRDKLHDIMSKYLFDDTDDIDSCLREFQQQLSKIKKQSE